MKKANGRKVDGRTKAGRTLARKRAAMAKARAARWKVGKVSKAMTAKEVMTYLAPHFVEQAETTDLIQKRMSFGDVFGLKGVHDEIVHASAPRAYTREVPRG